MEALTRSIRFHLFNLISLIGARTQSKRNLRTPVFIVGAPRSGTRLLESLLMTSGKFCSWSEANHVWEPHYYYFFNITTSRESIPPFTGKGVHAHEIPRVHEDRLRRRVKRLFSHYTWLCSRRLIHRNPFNSLRCHLLTDWFENPRVVHIYRDARAAVNSYVTKHRDNNIFTVDELADQAIYRWKTCFQRVRHFVRNNPEITTEIKYADLSGPESDARLSKVFEFCELSPSGTPWREVNVENRNYKWAEDLEPRIVERINDRIEDPNPEPLR